MAATNATFMRRVQRSLHQFLVLALAVSTLSAISISVAPSATAAGAGLSLYVKNESGRTQDLTRSEFTTGTCHTLTTSTINYEWGTDSPGGSCNSDGFTVYATGQILAPVTGTVTFCAIANDGFYLSINSAVVIDNWIDQGANSNCNSTGTYSMVAGQIYSIKTWMHENGGGANMQLLWSYTGQSSYIAVPASNLGTFCSPSSTSSGGYTILSFTTTGTCSWTIPVGITSADVLVVGGGGAGGGGIGGGGGAGEFIETTRTGLTGGSSVLISVGAGGTSNNNWNAGNAGGQSRFDSVIAYGGGGGGYNSANPPVASGGPNFGSQGGGGYENAALTVGSRSDGITGFRNNGGSGSFGASGNANGGGGGGAGGAGGAGTTISGSPAQSGGAGGAGKSSSITGTATFYAGGGGGGVNGAPDTPNGSAGASSGNPGAGGSSIGGSGGAKANAAVTGQYGNRGDGTGGTVNSNGSAGTANTGSGGGGASNWVSGGAGGSGIVIVKYVNSPSITLSTATIAGTTNSAISSYSITNSGGTASSYSINPALTSNGTLSFSTSTGLISGTPTATLTSTSYTITATNTSGTSTATFSLAINNPACSPTSNSSGGFTILTFTSTTTCSWSVPAGVTAADVLVVGGGGGGGSGGGGGGGFLSEPRTGLSGNVQIVAGSGGAGSPDVQTRGTNGGTSSFGDRSAGGGGGGGRGNLATGSDAPTGATQRGSGGGATSSIGTSALKSAGATQGGGRDTNTNVGGGGGGAGGAGLDNNGANAGNGGVGLQSSITGTSVYYAGGGRGAGGGSDGTGSSNAGGGGSPLNAGQSGVVIVRYINAPSISLSSSSITGTVSSAITSYSINTSSGGPVASYSISPALSTAGLSFSTSTGLISGTPTATLASTNYTITATNTSGTSTATFSLTVSLTCAAGGVCIVGDTGPGGGKVFYVAPGGGTFACGQTLSSTCRYLEAAPITGASAWTDVRYAWSGNTNTAIGTTSTAIGSGYSNTLKMVTQSGAGTSGAGSAARNYRGGGLNDWYLPSKDELNQLYINRTVASASAGYWSSSEYNATGAWDQGFGDGSQGVADPGKHQTTPVRPIRAFGSSAVESAIIYVPAIAGVTAPVSGATPVTTVTAANGYTGTVSWSSSPSTFAAATTYTATITLTASSGFTLTGVTANFFTVSGATSVTHLANSGSIAAEFPATAAAAQTITRTSTSPGSPVVAGTYTPTATASSGLTVAITIASGSSSICSISGGIVTFDAAGSCVIQYNQAGNASYAAASQVTETLTIGKGSQSITFGALSNRTLGSGTYSISATSSSSLTVAFTSATTSVCTVATTTITLVTAGTCTINANQSGDSNYLAATQVQQSFTVATALSITTPSGTSLQGTYNAAFTSLTISASGGAGTKTFAASGSLPTGVTLSSAGVISGTPSIAGDFSLTVTVTDANGATATTSSFTISIAKGVSTVSISVPAYTFTGSPQGPDSVTTSGSAGAVTYAYAGRGSTTYTSSSTKPTNVGTYTVTATLAADSNFASVSATADFQISNASLVITPTISASSMAYGTSGASLPTISHSKSPDVSLTTNPTCALYLASDTGFVTAQTLGSTLAAGSYVVRCAGAASTNYTITYGTNPSFTITKLDITLTVGTPASTPYTGSSVSVTNTFTRTSGTLAGSDAISGMTYTYTSVGGYNSTTAPSAAGTYTITGSSATFSTGSSNNYTITYVAGTLTISTATQTVTWAPTTALLTTDSPATPSSLATALGSATISYAVTSAGTTGCTVNSSTAVLTFSAAGSCQVTATAAATSNYATGSTAVTFVISLPTYVITLAAGTNGSGSNQTLTKTNGTNLTLPDSATANGYFTRAGYSVSGWSTTNLGSQTHALGGSFTTEAATTLYPVWTAVSCSPTSSTAFGYTIYKFTTTGTCFWTVPDGLTNVEVLVVAGGGGGGYSWGNTGAGGGGGGQVKTGTATLSSTLEVSVGAGGTAGTLSSGRGGSGGNSSAAAITALGGTGGCGLAAPTCSVASMATASAAANGGAGAASPGNGTRGRGGGGSSTTVSLSGSETGGVGTGSSYSGTSVNYGVGGNGGSPTGSSPNSVGSTGSVNTGNGGGGASTNSASNSDSALGANGGAGGSGVVIVRYGNTLTITYNANGGTTPSGGSTTTITGGTVSSLATTSRTGYTFNGWFNQDSGGTQITTSAAHNYYGNFTLFAQWTANALTVTYDSQGGSAVSNGSTTTGGSISASPGTPTRAGYTFNGWFAASTGGFAISFPYTHARTASFTLYAQWTANSLTITYDSQGGSALTNGGSQTGASIFPAPTAPTRAGYTLAGWSATATGSVVTFPYAHGQTASFTLYAQWTANSLTITYDSQGGSAVTNGGSQTGASISAAPTPPTRTGYTFSGWSTTTTGSVVTFPYAHGQTANFTLYAIWSANTQTITYAAGTDGTGSAPTSPTTVSFGSTFTTPANTYSRTGYTFAGWSDGTNVFQASVTYPATGSVSANVTLTATWTANTNSVAFNNNSGSGTMSTQSIVSGTATSLTSNSFTKTGYTFAGWNTNVDGTSGTNYTDGQSVTITAGMTLYAKWSANALTITYDSQGGSAVTNGGSQTGASISAAPTAPTRTGYTLAGWSTTTSGSVVIFPYAHGQTANFTLYAIWTANTLTVTYDSQGGSAVASGSVATGASISAAPTAPTRVGYTFSGWSTTSTGSVVSFTGGYVHGQTANFTLFAIWSANTLTVTYNSQSGSAVSNGTVNTGASIASAPTAPTRTGYTLDGWSATETGTVVVFPYAHGQTANFTLFAKWTGNTNTITYDSKGGSSVANGSFVTGGSIAAAPTTPIRAGYTLAGWSLTDGGSVISYPYSPPGTSGITLYAIWAGVSCSPTSTTTGGYTIYTFTTEGTCFWTVPNGVTDVEVLAVAGGGGGGYAWDNAGAGGGAGGQVKTGTATLGSILEVTVGAGGTAGIVSSTRGGSGGNSSVLTIAALGGTGGCGARATTCSNSAQATSSAAANGGIGGAGGASGRGGGGSNTTGSTTSSTTGGVGTASSFSGTSVTYGVGGSGGTARGALTNIAGTAGSANTGNGGGGASAKSSSGDVNGGGGGSGLVIVRVASALTVTFDSQSGSDVAAGSTVTGGSIATAPTAPTRSNYTFLGWFTATTGGSAISFPFAHGQTANFTLYARWSLNVYAITFNANNGTGTMGNQSFTHGVATNLNANLYSRANYVFHRWATAADGTGTTYNNLAEVTLTAGTTLYAQWTPNTYVVTFNYNGGDGGDSTATASFTTAGTAITLPVPTKTGFTFAGWHSDAALTTAIGSGGGSGSYSPTGAVLSLNAYAKWTAINYTFTYNSNSSDSGDVPTETSKQITQTATVKANTGSLVRAGYTFNGWNTASNGTGTNYLSGSLFTVGAANVVLYAKWTANTYTITYNTNGGTGNAQRSSANVTSDTYTTGGSSVVFPGVGTLERTGYTFDGWNTSAAGTGTNYAATNTYTTVSNVIFYAKWNPVTYTITYNGNTSNGGSVPTTGGYTTGQASPYVVLANTFTKSSNVFGGWNTAANGTGTNYSPDSPITTLANIVLYAIWIPQFTLHYAINGGTVTSGSLPSDTLYNTGTSVGPVFSSVSRTGYTFDGWANGATTIQGGSNFTILEDSVLTAKWTPVNYTISYNSDGGTEAPATITKQIGQSFAVGAAVSKPGYNFTGWSNGSTVVGADAVVVMGSTNIAYTAQWVARVYTVSYDWNGGRGTAVADVNYTFGTTAITLPLVGDRVKDGYTFAGWSESTSGSLLSATYIPTQSRTLYALWTLGNFTVTYNLSGGTLANTSVAVQNGSSTVLPLPTRAHFVFDGWHTATTGGSSVGSNGTLFTPTASQTVYARWIQASIYGITDSLTRIGSVVTVANVANTFSGANSNSSVMVSVPENALPAGTSINFDMVGNSSRATGLLPNVTYLISIAISWIAGDGTVPDTAAGKPISVTISNATIKTGATAYAIVNNVSTLLGTATQDGTITIALTSDPEVVIAAVKPSAPTNVAATSNGNQQSVISWSAPTSNGGSVITGYTVTSNTNATCTTSTTSCTISSLANGTAYTFTVTATNSVGTSVASSSASATTAALYAVTFDSKGGTSVTNGSFLTASTVSEPTAPTRTGYSFAGWSATDGGSVVTFPYAPGVTTAITMYARWDALDNAVTFDSKSGSTVASAIFSSGGTVAEPTAPTRTGYTFAGWSATDGGAAVAFPYAPGVVTDITLYAKWTVVSQNNTGGSGGGSSNPVPSTPTPSGSVTPVVPVKSNVTVVAPVIVVGDQDAKIIAVDIAIPAPGSNAKPLVIKLDKESEKFIAEVKVVEGKLALTPKKGFSGKKTVTVTITENGTDRIIQIPLTVLPEAVTKPVLTPTASNKSIIRWTESPNADGYTVYLNGKKVCAITALSCSVKTILGPDANIEIVSNGGDRTVSQRVDAEFRQNVPVPITRLVSATITKASLTRVDTKALDQVVALIKNQGFGTVVISEITTTSKTKALATARIESIKKYITSKIGTEEVEFEITPVKSRTYFNNISVKG